MTTEIVTKEGFQERLSLQEIADVLRVKGVDVFQVLDIPTSSRIMFLGSEEEGVRVLRIVQEKGFPMPVLTQKKRLGQDEAGNRVECDRLRWKAVFQ